MNYNFGYDVVYWNLYKDKHFKLTIYLSIVTRDVSNMVRFKGGR